MNRWVIIVFLLTGCANMNRFGTKMDNVTSTKPAGEVVHEGRMKVIREIGSMKSIQFDDGNFFDVREAPDGLRPGDIVRIYKTGDVYEARLHKAAE